MATYIDRPGVVLGYADDGPSMKCLDGGGARQATKASRQVSKHCESRANEGGLWVTDRERVCCTAVYDAATVRCGSRLSE